MGKERDYSESVFQTVFQSFVKYLAALAREQIYRFPPSKTFWWVNCVNTIFSSRSTSVIVLCSMHTLRTHLRARIKTHTRGRVRRSVYHRCIAVFQLSLTLETFLAVNLRKEEKRKRGKGFFFSRGKILFSNDFRRQRRRGGRARLGRSSRGEQSVQSEYSRNGKHNNY